MKPVPHLTPVESSNIDAIGHAGGDLYVRFKSGALYSYKGVPVGVHAEFLTSESPGRFFRDKVIGKYKHRQHDA